MSKYIKDIRMLNHCFAAEQVMRALARRLGRDEERWGLAGLVHDLDIELVGGDLSQHGLEAERILRECGADEELIEAVVMHNEVIRGRRRETELEHALAAAETVTGLIVATALVYPDRRLGSVKAKSVTKRMKERAFAASVSRDNIMECEKLGIPLDEFVGIALEAMQGISERMGL